jgi:ribonuclease J
MATVITCYGGINEIGGNKILVEDGDTRLSFDFGTSFGRRYQFFEEYLKPRPGVGLLDLLSMELLPPLEGIYRQDLVPTDDLWPSLRDSPLHKELSLDGVLLSHAHIDHSGYISFLDTDIPIYATAMTAFIAKAIQDSGQADFEKEVCYGSPRELKGDVLKTGKCYRQRPFAFVDGCPRSEEAEVFWSYSPAKTKPLELCGKTVPPDKIGRLPLLHFPVDHSIFGAAAFAVETSQGWVGYTGDLRLHGTKGHQTQRFIEEMRKLQPVVLICEGTHVDSTKRVSEEQVFINALKEIREAKGLVVADFGPRNVERLLTFYRIAQETGRKLVILGKDAYLLEAMRLVSDDVPDIGSLSDILIYKDPKARLPFWEEKLRQRYSPRTVDGSHVRTNQGECILCFSFWDIKHLIDIEPQEGVYVYSSSEAYSEEQQIDLKRLRNWLDHFGMKFVGDPEGREEDLHASGHASGPDLLKVIRGIRPRILIPIHTLNPGYFAAYLEGEDIEVHIPKLGEEIPIMS